MKVTASSPIGIFDSGVGGLSVAKAISILLPDEQLIYVADSAYTPYGEKNSETVQARSRHIVQFLIGKGAKAIVVACNTATAMAAERLRDEFELPIIAMEPAIKPAAELTQSDVIGVLATAGTLASGRYADLRDRHGHQVQVLEHQCTEWVNLVEQGELSSEQASEIVAAGVLPLVQAGADTLVLGCTHFHFLQPLIEKAAGEQVSIVDPAPAVAAQVRRRLAIVNLLATNNSQGNLLIYTSGDIAAQELLIAKLLPQAVAVKTLPG